MKNLARPPKKRRILPTLAKFLFSFALLAYIFTRKTSLSQVLLTLRHVDLPWLLISFSLHAVGLIVSAYRWQILIRAQGDDVPLKLLAQSYLVGTFFNNFLPTRFGGDVVRIWDGSKYSQSVVKSSAIVVVERLTGLLILFLFALGVSVIRLDLAHQSPFIWVALCFGAIGFAAVLAFLLAPWPVFFGRLLKSQRFQPMVAKIIAFRETIINYRQQKAAFTRAMLWALVLQLNVIIYYFLIGQSLHLKIPWLDYFMVIPVVHFIQLIPITINGLGLREGAYIEIFAFYSIPAQVAFSFSMVDVGFVLILGLVGGVLYVLKK
jgi:uncharacterized protein (TIRG00374 family)